MKRLGLIVFSLFTVLFLVGCGSKAKTYTVKFETNGGTPVEENSGN